MTLPLLPRATLVWCTTGVGLVWLAAWLRPELAHLQHPASTTFVEVLTALSAGTLLTCGGWFWLTLTTTLVGALRGHESVRLPSPRWMRQLAITLCGISVLAAPVGVHATPVAGEPPGAPNSPSLEGLRLPELPATREAAPRPAHDQGRTTVVVNPGDNLWSIARDQLSPGAAPSTIDRRWRQLWRANRSVVGDDPDLIHPGQRLVINEEEL